MNPNTLLLMAALLVWIVPLPLLFSIAKSARESREMSATHCHEDQALSALLLNGQDVSAATETVLGRVDKTARAVMLRREGRNYDSWVRAQVENLSKITTKPT